MEKLNNYLEKIQEEIEIDSKTALYLFEAILAFTIMIVLLFANSKRDLHLESILEKITGKKYFVRIVYQTQPNAFCFGGLGRSVFVTHGLITLLTEREIIAVCLHEIGHITNYDTIKNLAVAGASAGTTHLIINAFSRKIAESNFTKTKLISGVILTVLICLVILKAPGLLLGKIHEYRADRYASKYGYGKDLISALQKLEKWIKEYKFKMYGPETKFSKILDKISNFLDVHPEFKDRIKALLESEKLYEEIYNKNISALKKLCKEIFA